MNRRGFLSMLGLAPAAAVLAAAPPEASGSAAARVRAGIVASIQADGVADKSFSYEYRRRLSAFVRSSLEVPLEIRDELAQSLRAVASAMAPQRFVEQLDDVGAVERALLVQNHDQVPQHAAQGVDLVLGELGNWIGHGGPSSGCGVESHRNPNPTDGRTAMACAGAAS